MTGACDFGNGGECALDGIGAVGFVHDDSKGSLVAMLFAGIDDVFVGVIADEANEGPALG